jgi:hypothetical protein
MVLYFSRLEAEIIANKGSFDFATRLGRSLAQDDKMEA